MNTQPSSMPTYQSRAILLLFIAIAVLIAPPAWSETIMITWAAPESDVDGGLLDGIDIEYNVKGSNAETYTQEEALLNYSVIGANVTNTYFELTHQVSYCFWVFVTAIRTDVGLESEPSGVVEWCPGDDPDAPPLPQSPSDLEIWVVDEEPDA